MHKDTRTTHRPPPGPAAHFAALSDYEMNPIALLENQNSCTKTHNQPIPAGAAAHPIALLENQNSCTKTHNPTDLRRRNEPDLETQKLAAMHRNAQSYPTRSSHGGT
jgi:hypothetical protein